ncbi:hypothetical protein [Curtobacterium sp. TXMA1]|uniref:hypothetical protein n=1 Tax=Curtobacterium sp. TXMA1 TaxID=2876939 RepID=UPI001CC8F01A|nr:hypothetical protein [Curtobacterium sp. TXMA1]UBQ02753.1 hypothetical protein LCG91_00855 [Curtobacterium sp. TXMA1]
MNWWSEPWWAGVQGVCSVIGVLAITIAVADFLIRINHEPPTAMAFGLKREGEYVRDERHPYVTVTLTARPMGAHVLYEPEWRVWGTDAVTIPELPPVLDVRSDPASITLYLPHDVDLAKVHVGVLWVVPRRFGPYAAGARTTLDADAEYERWLIFRWRYWPRKTNGRWVTTKEAGKRSPMRGPF